MVLLVKDPYKFDRISKRAKIRNTHENKEQKDDEERLGTWMNKCPMGFKNYETHFEGSKKGHTHTVSEKNKETKLQTTPQ